MRILLAHNRYALRGGEDSVFDHEVEMLRNHDHEVEQYLKLNADLPKPGPVGGIALAAGTVFSRTNYREVLDAIDRFRPDVVHVHNTLPQISPSIYFAAAKRGLPVVQTLHNYRLLCANGLLMRDQRVCEDCVGRRVMVPAVRHKCYRDSVAASAAVATMLGIHRAIGTYRSKVTMYIALTEFSRSKLLEAGLNPEDVVIKPNFAADIHGDAALTSTRTGALFVGRLAEEKGVRVMAQAWRDLEVDLKVLGEGPLAPLLAKGSAPDRIDLRGFVSGDALAESMRTSSFIVMPSLVYEGFPMVVAEAYAAGLPIVASRLGALGEVVEDGVTGLHFEAGDAADLAAKVRWANEHPDEMARMGRNARERYLERYTPESNHKRLIEIYEEAQRRVAAG
ncbi:MAG: glycosyltransferase family 4 protein [Candidatus Limnocylindrales bacterium]